MLNKNYFFTTLLILFFILPLSGQVKADNLQSKVLAQDGSESTAAIKSRETVRVTDKKSSLFSTVKQGGLVMIPILLLAIFSLVIIIERGKYFLLSRSWNHKNLENYIESKMSGKDNLMFKEEMEEELNSAVQIYINKMEKGLGLLNGIGSLAPILGFFGTVIGMIEAFAAIAAATTVNAKVVAVGIQVALVTTAGGLAVAVPTLFFYHFYMHLVTKTSHHGEQIIDIKTQKYPRLLSRESVRENFA